MRQWVVLILFLFALGALRMAACGDYEDQGCLADPCEGVICPPDDNECTVEFCSRATGSCVSRPVEDGTSCAYNGLSGVCVEGMCGENLCEGVVCDDDDACTEDTCDYVDGTCDFTPVVCDDDNRCTEDTCEPADGCVFMPVEDGTACGSQGWACLAGDCAWTTCDSAEDCNDGNDCTEDTCNVLCENSQLEDNTPCAGGTCQAGVCELTGWVLPCTEQGIRNAIAAGGGPYTFDCGGPKTVVTGATIRIDNNAILDGEGNLTVDANATHRVFWVSTGVSAELRGVTVTGGATLQYDYGGGIYNRGTLTLTNSTVSGNAGGQGGGGILNGFDATLTVTNSTVSGNTADSGGGIENAGTLTVTNSTVSGNAADSRGGGLCLYNGRESLTTLTNSTVSGNTADSGGGLYYSPEGPQNVLTVTNSTVARNTTRLSADMDVRGPVTLTNSLVDGDCQRPFITSYGYNIESPGNTCGFNQTGDQSGVTEAQLNLGPLTYNGGPTMTHKPGDGDFGVGSFAIDQIPEADCEVAEDQRGEPRPETGGTMCDVGAVEVQ